MGFDCVVFKKKSFLIVWTVVGCGGLSSFGC